MCLLTQSLSFCFCLCTSILLTTSVYSMSSSAAWRRAWALMGSDKYPVALVLKLETVYCAFPYLGAKVALQAVRNTASRLKKRTKVTFAGGSRTVCTCKECAGAIKWLQSSLC